MGPDRPTWWLYGDSQLQGNRTYLNNTTRVEEWQLGVFGGLTSKNVTIAEQPMLELDGWLTLRSSEPAEIRVMQELRRELNEAIQWLAIAAVDDDSAATARAQAAGLRLRAAVGLLSGRAPDDAAREAAAPSERGDCGRERGTAALCGVTSSEEGHAAQEHVQAEGPEGDWQEAGACEPAAERLSAQGGRARPTPSPGGAPAGARRLAGCAPPAGIGRASLRRTPRLEMVTFRAPRRERARRRMAGCPPGRGRQRARAPIAWFHQGGPVARIRAGVSFGRRPARPSPS
ncbi:unnamed protein product [Prorocentrum cordatum]|uniref:Phospholipase B-like n=1 Tax=Prorocentrum cordatum TaxID=2364126 RepID=A0ABN9RZH8_9DINO|nr:unnamed protein product [Polarella glacialis]